LVSLVVTVILAVLALYFWQASGTAARADLFELAAGFCAGGALAVLLVRILRR
jgi:hypothetical protein